MRLNIIKIITIISITLFIVACGKTKNEIEPAAKQGLEQSMQEAQQVVEKERKETGTSQYKKGDSIPKELVCMVNDAFMGTEQLLVEFEGKQYYGCCEMCKARIPEDKTVRVALDPYTLKEVDKAEAYIVMIGNKGEVAYFANEDNYKKFLAEGK
ncbi:MAG: hypothetical protein LBE34_03165 [Flavobacteriaceae bacterium]|jgi:YHS domain-containing protein|nr:hypothetical protein [Flavobacteriaceae bacterium]